MANYKIIVEAIVQQANIQAQLDKMAFTSGTAKAIKIPATIDEEKINNQIKRWQDSLDKMQARYPTEFATPKVQQAVQAQKDLMASFDGTAKSSDRVKTAISNTSKEMTQAKVDINGVANESQNLSNIFKNLGATLESALGKIMLWGVGTAIIYGLKRQFSEMIQYLKDLDKEMTNIRIVTGMSQQDVQLLAGTFNELATQLGATTLEIAKGSTEWFRQGKTVQETAELMKSTMMMSKLGNMESAQATEYLTSTLNGFNLEAKDSVGIIDKLIALDNNYATSVSEIAMALQRSSAAGKLSGVSFDELASYITVVSSVTRKSADSIGESFKTIFARMESVKAGAQFDDMGESINNVEKVLKNLGIALRDTPTTFRPVGDVLDEIAKKWGNLDTVVRNQIAGAIGGVRQYTNIITLMDNWNQVLEAQAIAADSAGLAQKRYSIYLDSVEAATNRLTSAWNKLATSTSTSSAIKSIINLGTSLVEIIDKIGIANVAIITLSAVLSSKLLLVIPGLTVKFLN
jgi:TP901 family phage tail tape measure protein